MGIPSRHASKVNSAPLAITLVALLLGAAALSGARAGADNPPRVPSPADILPDIEAREFDVKVVRRSKSAKTYLFEDVTKARTRVGKILLARKEGAPMMAFRIVKTYYPEKNEFAAKQVRTYRDVARLEPGETFSGLEKVSDIVPPPPTAQDRADLKELEAPLAPPPPAGDGLEGLTTPPAAAPPAAGSDGLDDLMNSTKPSDGTAAPEKTAPIPTAPAPEVQEFDSELDAAASPAEGDGPAEEEDEDEHMGVSVEETNSFDTNRSWLTAEVGYFQNVGPLVNGGRGTAYFAGAGLRYGYTLGKEIFLRTSKLQDSLALELGGFIYKIVSFETNQGDSYNVAPVTFTGRYNILFSENFGIFFYMGVTKNFVFSPVNASGDTQAALGSLGPAGGGGLIFRIGPSWHVRADLGYDMIGAGLTLRF